MTHNKVDVKTKLVYVESWLHKYIIGKKGANIKSLTQDIPQLEFLENHIRLEGPPNAVENTLSKLTELVENLKKQLSYEEVRVNPSYHDYIVGNKLKQNPNTIIHIPQQGDADDVISIEGDAKDVAHVKEQILELSQKLEKEIVRDVFIEQRFHGNFIGGKGESIKEISKLFNQVVIIFPHPNSTEKDRVSIRGNKEEVNRCCKYLSALHEEMKNMDYSVKVSVDKQNHKFIIGKKGTNIKKIKEETNTEIYLPVERAQSDLVIIRGRKENVLEAKEKILAMQEELADTVVLDVLIPAALHNNIIGKNGTGIDAITEQCKGVSIKFPKKGSGSDLVNIRGPTEKALMAKQLLLELSNEKQLKGYTAKVKVEPRHHTYLIGENGININRIREKTGAKIIFPDMFADERDIIQITGRIEQVNAAKKELEIIISQLVNIIQDKILIDPKYHRHFFAKECEILNQIEDEFASICVNFPVRGSGSNVVVLKGNKYDIDGAKKRMSEVISDLESQVTTQCVIPKKYHGFVLGPKGYRLQNLEREYDVKIKFPDLNHQYEKDGHCVSRWDGATCTFASEDTVLIKGKKENCSKVTKVLLDLVPVIEQVEIPHEFHRFIIGKKGQNVRVMMDAYNVKISIPPEQCCSNVVMIEGTKDDVNEAKAALKKKIGQLELEKQDKERLYKDELHIDSRLHSGMIGPKGINIKRLCKQFGVDIHFANRNDPDPDLITIVGDADGVYEAGYSLYGLQEESFLNFATSKSRGSTELIKKANNGKDVSTTKSNICAKTDIPGPQSSATPREPATRSPDKCLNMTESSEPHPSKLKESDQVLKNVMCKLKACNTFCSHLEKGISEISLNKMMDPVGVNIPLSNQDNTDFDLISFDEPEDNVKAKEPSLNVEGRYVFGAKKEEDMQLYLQLLSHDNSDSEDDCFS